MLKKKIDHIIQQSQTHGWVMEPDAKTLLMAAGLPVAAFTRAKDERQATAFAEKIGYPVVAKVISRQIVHKSEVGGVIVGIETPQALKAAHARFKGLPGFEGMLVEQMLSGVEIIAGAVMDAQFGPTVLLGIGGTGVELYNDTTLRMAPLTESDAKAMLGGLRGGCLLMGYRGGPAVDMAALVSFMLKFSELTLYLNSRIESMDLNPVICSSNGCQISDARIILAAE